MTDDQFQNKWANHLAGKFVRFAFAEVSGPGLEARVRGLVAEIDKAVELMLAEARGMGAADAVIKPANGTPQPVRSKTP